MIPSQWRGVYPYETRAQSKTKPRPETIISITAGSPKLDKNYSTIDNELISIYLDYKSENTFPDRLVSTRSRPHELPACQEPKINSLGSFKKACVSYVPTSLYSTEYLSVWSKNTFWTPQISRPGPRMPEPLEIFTVENMEQQ